MGVSALDVYGIDWVCERVGEEATLTQIAREASVATATLLNWINADPDRSARVKAARSQMAAVWDERATEVIQAAGNPFELAKARELAQHYRWRASKISPAYNDKVVQEHTGNVEVTKITRTVVD